VVPRLMSPGYPVESLLRAKEIISRDMKEVSSIDVGDDGTLARMLSESIGTLVRKIEARIVVQDLIRDLEEACGDNPRMRGFLAFTSGRLLRYNHIDRDLITMGYEGGENGE